MITRRIIINYSHGEIESKLQEKTENAKVTSSYRRY
jgi:hypothetical protein